MKIKSGLSIACKTSPQSPRAIQSLKVSPRQVFNNERSPLVSPTEVNRHLLRKLNSRLILNSEKEISPEIAAKVVKKFIIPMFEFEKKMNNDLNRSSVQGKSRKFSCDQSTVYGEFKLSEKLSGQLSELEKKCKLLNQQVSYTIQDKKAIEKEFDAVKSQLIDSQTNFEIMVSDNSRLNKELSETKSLSGFASLQALKYQSLYETSLKENERLMKILNEQQVINDIRLLIYMILNF